MKVQFLAFKATKVSPGKTKSHTMGAKIDADPHNNTISHHHMTKVGNNITYVTNVAESVATVTV